MDIFRNSLRVGTLSGEGEILTKDPALSEFDSLLRKNGMLVMVSHGEQDDENVILDRAEIRFPSKENLDSIVWALGDEGYTVV